MNKPLRDTLAFEDTVRRVAEAVWRLEPGEVQPAWYRNDPVLRELDGIARLPDVTHLLMVTTSTRLLKVKEDVEKLNKAEKKERPRGVLCKKWFITEQQLSAEHIDHARKHGVEAITFSQFRDRFFNGRDYITKRRNAPFGSSRNLRDGSVKVPDDEYAALPMLATTSEPLIQKQARRHLPTNINDIVGRLNKGECVCLVGPFGAGKSLTAREIFFELSKLYTSGMASTVPVFLNLREHWGAIYGDEILERHARSIGFTPRETLTVAWRAGIVHMLLDGFDEVATQAIARPTDKSFMRRTRYEALQAVRDLVTKSPPGVGILICGRDHYFDNIDEMCHALGLTTRPFTLVTLGEFTEESARQFLRRHAATEVLPDWLPRKPLLLGYLAHQKLLDEVLAIDASRGFGYAWDSFLRLVCQREAEHDRAVMDPATIRHVLERLACIARGTSSGNGPITGLDLAEAYRQETGEVPGEGVLMQLQRLPGLTPREQDPAARSFVDSDLLAALQGSAIARSILEDVTKIVDRTWAAGLSREGVRMAAHMLEVKGLTFTAVIDVARRISRDHRSRTEYRQLVTDLFMVAVELSGVDQPADGRDLMLFDGNIAELDLEDRILQNVTFRDCSVDEIFLGDGLTKSSCKFEGCIFLNVNGATSSEGLPSKVFSNCDFEKFDDASTNAAILRLDIPPAIKALMTILHKLYLQAGGGRKIEALKRGMPGGGSVYSLIDPVLRILETEGMVSITGNVVHPIRRHLARVRQILNAGTLSQDPLVERVKTSAS